MSKIKYWINLGVLGDDVDCEVFYDYSPSERQTNYYPGCTEKIEVIDFTIDGVELSKTLEDMVFDYLNADDVLLDMIRTQEEERGQ